MVRPAILGLAAIPGIAALLLVAVPLLTQPEIPSSAANPSDRLDLELTRHQLESVSPGLIERAVSQKSEVFRMDQDGGVTYLLITGGSSTYDMAFQLDPDQLLRLVAFVKETGVASIPSESFPVRDGTTNYQKSVLKITLNGAHRQLSWPDQNSTDAFVPPILTHLESKIDGIITDHRWR